MAENPMQGLMDTAMRNIKSMIDVNTIVGEPVNVPDGTVIIPISKVGFGFGAGGCQFETKKATPTAAEPMFGGGCGGGASIKPIAFLVVGNGTIRLLPVEGTSSPIDRVIEMVPELLDKMNCAVKDMSAHHDEKKKQKQEAKDAKKAQSEPQVVNVVE